MQEKGLLECFGTYKTYGNFEHIRGRTFRTVETIHRWRRLLSDDATGTSPRMVETIPGWQRLLSDDGDFSTDGGDYPWMAKGALSQQSLLNGRWRLSMDGEG